MSAGHPEIRFLRDPRLAAHALSARPAWLWRANGAELLWANPAGMAVLTGSAAARLPAAQPAGGQIARQVAHIATTLLHGAPPRLERLRGMAAGGQARFGASLVQCVRLTVADSISAILVLGSAESAVPKAERRQALLSRLASPAALADGDGLVHDHTADAPPVQQASETEDQDAVVTLGELVAEARARGECVGRLPSGLVTVSPVGGDGETFLVTWERRPQPLGDRGTGEAPADEAAPAVPASAPCEAAQSTAATDTERDADTSAEAAPAPGHLPPVLIPDPPRRRYPLRFVWQMDANGRFTLGSNEFTDVLGPGVAGALGRRWTDIATDLDLDPAGEVARAVATRATWSGITVMWPADDLSGRLPVELSALPIFGRDRSFRGYRGFGVCRDLERLEKVASLRAAGWQVGAPSSPPADTTPAPDASAPAAIMADADAPRPDHAEAENPAEAEAAEAINVVPFPGESRGPVLTAVEHHAFHELARRLNDRLGVETAAMDPAEADRANERSTGADPDHDGGETPGSEAAAREDDPLAPAATAGTDSKRLREVLSSVVDGVLTLDGDYRIVDADPPGAALFGATPQTMKGRRIADWLSDESERLLRDDLRRLASKGGSQTRDLLVRRPDGEAVQIAATFAAITTEPPRLLALLRDSSGQLRTERDLHDARQQAERAMLDKAGFLTKVSHEVRTPLNAIIGFATMMMDERFGPLGNERYAAYLKDIQTSGEHVVAMLNDLLDLSRIEAGTIELAPEHLALNETIQQCVGLMQPQAVRERVIIRLALSPRLPVVSADAKSLRQIVLNLLTRSIGATAPGGQIIVSTALTDSGDVTLRVRDGGAPMSESEINAALHPFSQLSASGAWSAEEAGLGLPLAKALADANHARFNLTSSPAGTLAELVFSAVRLRIPAE